jgi:hypothetical protein
MTTNELSDWKASLDDLLLHRWEFSSSSGRSKAINMVERLMNGEIIEVVEVEPPKVAEARDDIKAALDLDNDEALVQLVAVIARAMTGTDKPDQSKRNFISAE